MKSLSMNAVAAAHAVAAAIEGYGEEIRLSYEPGAAVVVVPVGGHYTELRLDGDGVRSARVTIERPELEWNGTDVKPTRVSWSSSSSSSSGARDALATADLLRFACAVAGILDGWATRGELPRLGPVAS